MLLEFGVPTSWYTTMSKCASVNFFRLDYYLVEIPKTFRHAKIVYQVIGTSSSDLRQSICRNVKRLIGLRWPRQIPASPGWTREGWSTRSCCCGQERMCGVCPCAAGVCVVLCASPFCSRPWVCNLLCARDMEGGVIRTILRRGR